MTHSADLSAKGLVTLSVSIDHGATPDDTVTSDLALTESCVLGVIFRPARITGVSNTLHMIKDYALKLKNS